MEKLAGRTQEIWKEIKNQPKDVWFFYLFLLTFTLGVRKVILFFPIKRAFNEYAGVYVYASDIFLYLAILVWIISILYNKITILSSSRDAISEVIHKIDYAESVDNSFPNKLSTGKFAYFKALFTEMFHVEHFDNQAPKNCSTWNNLKYGYAKNCSTWNIFDQFGIFFIPLLLVIWSFISIIWSENQIVSFYRSARFLELYLLFIYVVVRLVPYLMQCLRNCSTWNNLELVNDEIVPRGTILDESESDNEKMFHVEHFDYVLFKVIQYFRAILLGLVVITLFDHYLWDIWQGQVLFWLVCGILAGIGFKQSNLSNCSTLLRQGSGGQAWNISSKDSYQIVPRGTIKAFHIFFTVIMLLGVVHSLIGIAQFITQQSLGLFWLKESLIGPDIAGAAKIIVNYQPFIRAYGLFPHPNILGGFLFFSIMITLLCKKLFHVEQFREQDSEKCSTLLRRGFGGQAWNNLNNSSKISENVPRGTFWSSLKVKVLNQSKIVNLILLIQIFGILLSFSKSAILALGVAFVYIIVPPQEIHKCSTWNIFGLRGGRGTSKFDDLDSKKSGENDFANCSTWNNFLGKIFKMFHVEHFRLAGRKIALSAGFFLLALISLIYFKFDFQAFFVKSLEERGLYLSISQRIISESPIIGVGTGQFVFEAEKLFLNLAAWQYQPVHNVLLLIWSEWGIVGLVLFILFLWKLFHLPAPRLRQASL